MILKVMCEHKSSKEIIRIGQMLLSIGLGCNAAAILLNRSATNVDFIQGFLTGLGIVAMLGSIYFNVRGLKMQKNEE